MKNVGGRGGGGGARRFIIRGGETVKQPNTHARTHARERTHTHTHRTHTQHTHTHTHTHALAANMISMYVVLRCQNHPRQLHEMVQAVVISVESSLMNNRV